MTTTDPRFYTVPSSISAAAWIMDRTQPCTDGCEGEHHHSCPKIVQTVEGSAGHRVARMWNDRGA